MIRTHSSGSVLQRRRRSASDFQGILHLCLRQFQRRNTVSLRRSKRFVASSTALSPCVRTLAYLCSSPINRFIFTRFKSQQCSEVVVKSGSAELSRDISDAMNLLSYLYQTERRAACSKLKIGCKRSRFSFRAA
jgi:hypothetical protein